MNPNIIKSVSIDLLKCFINKNATRTYCMHVTTKIVNPATNRRELVPSMASSSIIHKTKLPPPTKIDEATIAHLERLSLVDCANRQGIETLEAAIAFADQIKQLKTEGVDPLITVLEDQALVLREDEVTELNLREDVLSNAVLTEDDYFVAPPGNIPLEARENLLHENVNNDSKM